MLKATLRYIDRYEGRMESLKQAGMVIPEFGTRSVFKLAIAIAYYDYDGRGTWVSKGWYQIEANHRGFCEVILSSQSLEHNGEVFYTVNYKSYVNLREAGIKHPGTPSSVCFWREECSFERRDARYYNGQWIERSFDNFFLGTKYSSDWYYCDTSYARDFSIDFEAWSALDIKVPERHYHPHPPHHLH